MKRGYNSYNTDVLQKKNLGTSNNNAFGIIVLAIFVLIGLGLILGLQSNIFNQVNATSSVIIVWVFGLFFIVIGLTGIISIARRRFAKLKKVNAKLIRIDNADEYVDCADCLFVYVFMTSDGKEYSMKAMNDTDVQIGGSYCIETQVNLVKSILGESDTYVYDGSNLKKENYFLTFYLPKSSKPAKGILILPVIYVIFILGVITLINSFAQIQQGAILDLSSLFTSAGFIVVAAYLIIYDLYKKYFDNK